MFLQYDLFLVIRICLPHRRGDVSDDGTEVAVEAESSPQAWGCFLLDGADMDWAFVFPTGVGMFLRFLQPRSLGAGLPHRRGDVSG